MPPFTRIILLTVGTLLLLWLVASMALWAVGYPARLIVSGIIAGVLGLLLTSLAVGRR